MELTYEKIVEWLESYLKTFNKNAGPIETVPNMQKFFTPDLEFWSYNMANAKRPSNREALLMSMVHPGLHEELTPREFIVDMKRMVVVIQFQLQFSDQPSGTQWPPKQASAHYTLTLDENKELKIKKIQYWVEATPPGDQSTLNMRELWAKYKNQALENLGNNWIKAQGKT